VSPCSMEPRWWSSSNSCNTNRPYTLTTPGHVVFIPRQPRRSPSQAWATTDLGAELYVLADAVDRVGAIARPVGQHDRHAVHRTALGRLCARPLSIARTTAHAHAWVG
jgi:hypothetical protein